MFDRDNWNEILEALTSNVFRTVLTAFGVFWGIFILVILLAAGNGLENGVKKGFDGIATNTMFMWTRTTSKPYKGLPKTRRYDFRNGDVAALKESLPDLLYVSPRNQLGDSNDGVNNVVRGTKTAAFTIYGDYPELIKQQPMDIIKGRFVNQQDILQKRKVAVIGKGVISGLYEKEDDPIGTYVKINGVNFMVVGVYYSKSQNNGNAESEQKNIFVPFTTFQQAFNYGDKVGWMALTANDKISITELKPKILDLMKTRHSINPEDNNAVGNFDLSEEFNKVQSLFSILKFIAYFVGSLVLISGVIGISNIMLIVVKERTKEIGIRRALGATPGAIRRQILSESIFLTIISGMLGIAVATGIIAILNKILSSMPADSNTMFANPTVDLGVVFVALLILVGSGLLAGFIPAQTAINVKPVDALRAE
ncbi:ABC transporter permease [Flavobacterium hydatis]|jgi:putative ABC transport system permease protein|uniref:Multidrug ABC transporter ATP-binding protein n=1 Tax=Flavobacterium hydatis TaxID=991 RepID=A0A086AT15_FLAHY|nr:ABC transporter permease [Flavobacterium hydatis]KFF19829.1 multidrug ABC transporter ATP-binding protein [Flavobacterium hydatis]OXA91603.1 multidrug ABC transporter ATP-binding protein [Flavobacterium hydatis]